MSPRGRFTVRGGEEVERLMGALSDEIAETRVTSVMIPSIFLAVTVTAGN